MLHHDSIVVLHLDDCREAKIFLIYSRYSDLLIDMIVEFHAW